MAIRNIDQVHQMFERIFPSPSTKRYARLVDVGQRTVQRWFTIEGGRPSEKVGELIRQQEEALAASRFPARLDEIIGAARKAGLHDELIAAWLAHAYRGVAGSEIE